MNTCKRYDISIWQRVVFMACLAYTVNLISILLSPASKIMLCYVLSLTFMGMAYHRMIIYIYSTTNPHYCGDSIYLYYDVNILEKGIKYNRNGKRNLSTTVTVMKLKFIYTDNMNVVVVVVVVVSGVTGGGGAGGQSVPQRLLTGKFLLTYREKRGKKKGKWIRKEGKSKKGR